jgi:F-box domain
MAGHWDRVPSVVLHEIYKLLDTEDKLRASSTCRHWRQVFYQSFAPTGITFRVRTSDQNSCDRSQFLASCWGNRLRNAVVEFDSTDAATAEKVADVLQYLGGSCHLRQLSLRPSHCIMEVPQGTFLDRFDVCCIFVFTLCDKLVGIVLVFSRARLRMCCVSNMLIHATSIVPW